MRLIILTIGLFFIANEGFSGTLKVHNDSILERKLRHLEERLVRQERKINRLEVENDELKASIHEMKSAPVIRLGRRTTINRVGSKQLVSE